MLQARSLRELSTGYYNTQQIESLIVTQRIEKKHFYPVGDPVIYVATNGTEATASAPEQIVGVASLMPYAPMISALFVHPEFVRRGVASRLLRRLEAIAYERRYEALSVTASLVAIPCYQSAGYRIVHHCEIQSQAEKIGCAFMHKSLPLRPMNPKEKAARSQLIWLAVGMGVLILVAIALL